MNHKKSSIEISQNTLIIAILLATMLIIGLTSNIVKMKSEVRIAVIRLKAIEVAQAYADSFMSENDGDMEDNFTVQYILEDNKSTVTFKVKHEAHGILLTTTANIVGVERSVQYFIPQEPLLVAANF